MFRFLKLVILISSWTRFNCLSREAKSSDCCFDRYKSRARSFRSSCVIQSGSLPLVPEYVDSISSLFTGGVGTGRSSELGTGLIAGYYAVSKRMRYPTKSKKIFKKNMENSRVELTADWKSLADLETHIPERCTVTITICNNDDTTQSHSQEINIRIQT